MAGANKEMITILSLIRRLSPALLLLSITYASASSHFQMAGTVYQINSQTINVSDRQYLISPTVKVYSAENRPIPISEIFLNDMVALDFITLGDNQMVDTIHKIDDPEASFARPEERIRNER
ncbi:MAG: hypothetical protein H8E21_13320 [Gammaproteobacteria bacterium]|nr:hypothetical protein [Gammaproteobacteria bacterium]MBL7000278.1 hypothetical protein [Gammaproteobacteria bacterium]